MKLLRRPNHPRLFLFILGLSFGILSSCAITPLSPQGEKVKIVFDLPDENKCRHLGDVFGIEGNLFDFWFISNKNVVLGSLNDLKNNTANLNGNLAYIHTELAYTTSTALLGIAFQYQ